MVATRGGGGGGGGVVVDEDRVFLSFYPTPSTFSPSWLFFHGKETILLPATEVIALRRLRLIVYNAIFLLILAFSSSVWLFVAFYFFVHSWTNIENE